MIRLVPVITISLESGSSFSGDAIIDHADVGCDYSVNLAPKQLFSQRN
jgi:hypothetical protein